MGPIAYPIRSLHLPHIFNNRYKLFLSNLRLRRHVSEWPMVLSYPKFGSHKKGLVGMMAWIINFMDKSRTFICPGCIRAMTLGAICIKGLLAADGK